MKLRDEKGPMRGPILPHYLKVKLAKQTTVHCSGLGYIVDISGARSAHSSVSRTGVYSHVFKDERKSETCRVFL